MNYNILDLKTKADTLRRELKRTNKLLTKEIKAYVKNTPLDVLYKKHGRAIKKKTMFPFLWAVSDKELNSIMDIVEDTEIVKYVISEIWVLIPKNIQRSIFRVYLLERMVKQ